MRNVQKTKTVIQRNDDAKKKYTFNDEEERRLLYYRTENKDFLGCKL